MVIMIIISCGGGGGWFKQSVENAKQECEFQPNGIVINMIERGFDYSVPLKISGRTKMFINRVSN